MPAAEGRRIARAVARRPFASTTWGAPTAIWTSAGATLMAISAGHDPRIDDGLEHVDREIEKDEEGGEHQDHALEHRDVTLKDSEVQEIPRARPREHGLDQHRAAQLEAELQADDGQDLGAAFFTTWAKTVRLPRPFARSASTKSWARISSAAERTTRVMTPSGMSASATVGRVMWRR